jgi:hypothetical protein
MPNLNVVDQMTAIEAAKRSNSPDAFNIIECLRETNEMLIDLPALKANDGTHHVTLRRKNRPEGTHRLYNQGVETVSSQTDTIRDSSCILEAYSVVDADMANHTGNPEALRRSEAVGIIKGMGKQQARILIKGDNSANKEEITGLENRLNKLGNQVISMGGSGSGLTSLYLIASGPDFCHLFYPAGSNTVGVERKDLEQKTWHDDAGKPYEAYVEFFSAQYGIAIRDPGAAVRICNIPAGVSGDDLIDKILEMRRKMPSGASTYSLFANLDILIKIDKTARDRSNVVYTAQDPWGKEITHIRDIRCRQQDAITNDESAVA